MIIRKWGRYSIFGWFNILFCQWLFFRVEAEAKVNRIEFDGECDYLLTGVNVIFPIVPLTGWVNAYVPQRFCRWHMNAQSR